jgi:hypothetical protein
MRYLTLNILLIGFIFETNGLFSLVSLDTRKPVFNAVSISAFNDSKVLKDSVSIQSYYTYDGSNGKPGTVTIYVLGGTKPYTVTFNNKTGNNDIVRFEGVLPGKYTLNIKDGVGLEQNESIVLSSGSTTD